MILLSYYLILRKSRLLMRNLAMILPLTLDSKLSGKFERFNAIDGNIEMLKNGWIFKKLQSKWKIEKEVHETQTLSKSKEIILPPTIPAPPDEILLRLWNKNVLNQIYRNIQKYTENCFQSVSRMKFLGVKKWCSVDIFSNTKQKYVCWKICSKVRKVFGCVVGAYYFQFQVS